MRITPKRASYRSNHRPFDIYAQDAHDQHSVTDYVRDMYEHYRSVEEISPPYCTVKQYNIDESTRGIFVDWLIEIHDELLFVPETLYLATNIFDRFLAQTKSIIDIWNLQLVVVTSLLISAKYEEGNAPELCFSSVYDLFEKKKKYQFNRREMNSEFSP